MNNWYVIASYRGAGMGDMRIVAGPLSLDMARMEAAERLRARKGDIVLNIVEFDEKFGLLG